MMAESMCYSIKGLSESVKENLCRVFGVYLTKELYPFSFWTFWKTKIAKNFSMSHTLDYRNSMFNLTTQLSKDTWGKSRRTWLRSSDGEPYQQKLPAGISIFKFYDNPGHFSESSRRNKKPNQGQKQERLQCLLILKGSQGYSGF